MGKKASVPEYSSATVDTGSLFGSSTADKNGVNFNPASWQTKLSNTVTSNFVPTINNMNNSLSSAQNILNSLTSGDYLNDRNFKVYQNDFNERARNAFDTNVLGNLADRGLMSSSGARALTSDYNEVQRQGLADLMDNYYNRMANNYSLTANQYGLYGNNLSNLLNTQNSIYNWLTGVGQMAQNQANSVSNHNVNKAQIEAQQNAANSALFASLANTGANLFSDLANPLSKKGK